MTARVALAVAKTHSMLHRIQIARGAILSKILFVVRHEWLAAETVAELQSMIKRFI